MSLHNQLDTRLATVIKKMLTQPGLTVEQATTEAATHIEQDLLAAIPDEKVGTEKMPLNQAELGYNIAIQDCRTAITAYCKGETK